ncbi:hypothetical protein ACO1O0_007059 [Amphichorda felina]
MAVWFVTATSSGFGREIARIALARGDTVIATARNTAKIENLKQAGAHVMPFDVTWPLADMQATAKTVFERFGRVDYLVNAAGYVLAGALEELGADEVQGIFNTNVFGIMTTLKAFLPHMREQEVGADGVRATVAAIGSMASWEGAASYGAYSMTKFCVSSMMEVLRQELEPFHIQATVIEPGAFRTGFLSPTAKVESKEQIPAYEDESTPTGRMRAILKATDGVQQGDVRKGCDIIVDMLTRTGVAEGKELPARIVLGSDCEKAIRDKCARTVSLLDEWQDVIRSTDYLKGE